ncbi:phage baseplate protein [Apilactobacillus xinyiensis]|uniref:phage baseplate protein n=1 Tax=Apilactobacillus xinyiensis TaxID=2841032 RepID=UPI00336521B7
MSKLDTRTWRKLRNKVKKYDKAVHSLTNRQAKILQEAANAKATIKSSQDSINLIYKDLMYSWKKEKHKVKHGKRTYTKTTKKWTKRDKPQKPTKRQSEQLSKLSRDLAVAQAKHSKIINSGVYKQTKKHKAKLAAKLKIAKRHLAKFEARRRKTAAKSISKAINKQYADFMAPKASIYETQGTTGKVVFLFTSSETEDNQSTVTGYPVDHDEEVSDHSVNGDKTVSIEGTLIGHTPANNLSATQLYNELLNWRYKGTELTYRSDGAKSGREMAHIYNKHFRIQSLTKTQDQALKDQIKVSITFKFVYVAQVATTKSKVNHKGKKVSKGSCTAPKVIKGKKGMTMHDYAKKYHMTTKKLVSMNKNRHYTAHTNLAGKKLQVTAGSFKPTEHKRKVRLHHAKTSLKRR